MSTSTDAFTSEVTRRVRHAMVDAGLSVASLARLTGMSRHTLARRLSGLGDFDMTELFKVATALNVTPESLLSDVAAEQVSA